MKKFDPKKARALSQKIRDADTALCVYLREHFPAGHRCDVLLNARQKKPTPAVIHRVEGGVYGGSIAIELDNAKERSRNRIRHLAPAQVLNVRPAEGDQA